LHPPNTQKTLFREKKKKTTIHLTLQERDEKKKNHQNRFLSSFSPAESLVFTPASVPQNANREGKEPGEKEKGKIRSPFFFPFLSLVISFSFTCVSVLDTLRPS
jgi:hypothetical protein